MMKQALKINDGRVSMRIHPLNRALIRIDIEDGDETSTIQLEPQEAKELIKFLSDEIEPSTKLAPPKIDLNEVEKLVQHSAFSDAYDAIMGELGEIPDDIYRERIRLMSDEIVEHQRKSIGYQLSDLQQAEGGGNTEPKLEFTKTDLEIAFNVFRYTPFPHNNPTFEEWFTNYFKPITARPGEK